MPASYDLDPESRLVRSRVWGVIGNAETQAHYAKMKADGGFDPGFRQLCDLTDLDRLELTPDDLRALARLRVFAAGAKRAFVAPVDHHFGLARMLEVYSESEGSEVRVFRTRAEAEEWLGLGPAPGT